MSAILEYRSAPIKPRVNAQVGRVAAAVAIVSGLGIICLAHQCRMSMVTWKGAGWGNPQSNSRLNLYLTGILLLFPAVASWLAWHAKSGFAVCRTSFAAASLGWLFYVVTTFVGLPL